MKLSAYQNLKLFIVELTAIPKDSLHILIGFFVYLMTLTILKNKTRQFVSVIPCCVVAIAMEVIDMRDNFIAVGDVRLGYSVYDFFLTTLIPLILLASFRFGLFKNQ